MTNVNRKIKQVIIIRRDLNSRRGKEICMGSHSSNAFFLDRILRNKHEDHPIRFSEEEFEWMENGFKKVCLQVQTKEELIDIYEKAKSVGLEAHIIRDEGLTEYKQPEYTAVAIGPNFSDEIDVITKDLRLY